MPHIFYISKVYTKHMYVYTSIFLNIFIKV